MSPHKNELQKVKNKTKQLFGNVNTITLTITLTVTVTVLVTVTAFKKWTEN